MSLISDKISEIEFDQQIYNRALLSDNRSTLDSEGTIDQRTHIEKSYKSILFKANTPLQSAELNELQTIVLNEIKQLSDKLYKGSGALIDGGDITIVQKQSFEFPHQLPGLTFKSPSNESQPYHFRIKKHLSKNNTHITYDKSADNSNVWEISLPIDDNDNVRCKTSDLYEFISTSAIGDYLPLTSLLGTDDKPIKNRIELHEPLEFTNNVIEINTFGESTIYYDGFSVNVSPLTSPLLHNAYTQGGEENQITVGITVKVVDIDYNDDRSLLDPSAGYNYDNDGAHRLKIHGVWNISLDTENSDSFFGVWLVKGNRVINSNRIDPELRGVVDVVGRYDFNSNGNYVISGQVPAIDTRKTYAQANLDMNGQPNKIFMNISKGSANITGYNIEYSYDQRFDYDSAFNESYILNKSSRYVKETFKGNFANYTIPDNGLYGIKSVTGYKYVANKVIQRSSDPEIDVITIVDKDPEVFYIDFISNVVVSGDTTYTRGIHWELDFDSNNGYHIIRWISSTKPEENSSYTVEKIFHRYRYKSETSYLTMGTSIDEDVKFVISEDRTNLFVNQSLFGFDIEGEFNYKLEFNYDIIKPRIDRLVLKRSELFSSVTGEYSIIYGNAGYGTAPLPPEVEDSATLSLATVYLEYGKPPVITQDYFRTFKMSDINKLYERVNKLEYDISKNALVDQARADGSTSNLQNIFVDNFKNTSMMDLNLIKLSNVPQVSIEDGSIVPHTTWRTDNLPTSYKQRFIRLDKYKNSDNITITRNEISQTFYSDTERLNSLTTSAGKSREISLSITPKDYKWIFRTDSSTVNNSWARDIDTTTDYNEAPVPLPSLNVTITAPANSFSPTNQIVGNGTPTTTKLQLFIENEEYQFSTQPTVNADGSMSITINLQGYNSGIKSILVQEDITQFTSNENGEYLGAFGITSFTSQPQVRTIINYNPPPPPPRRYNPDPTAQSFYVKESFNLDSVQVWLDAESTSNWKNGNQLTLMSSIQVVLCELTNGYPDVKKTLTTQTIPFNDDGSGESYSINEAQSPSFDSNGRRLIDSSSPFVIRFDENIKLQNDTDYAFIFVTLQTELTLKIAKLGAQDINTNNWIVKQPYQQGLKFVSSNFITWTAVQDTDLWFNISSCLFKPAKQLVYNLEYTNPIQMSDFQLLSTEKLDVNTSIHKKIEFTDKTNNKFEFNINSFDPIQTEMIEVKSAKVTVDLNGTQFPTGYSDRVVNTPIFTNSVQLSTAKVEDKSIYITKSIDNWTIQNDLNLYMNIKNFRKGTQLSGRNVRAYYSLTGGMTWNELIKVENILGNADENKFSIDHKRISTRLRFPNKDNISGSELFQIIAYNYNDGNAYVFHITTSNESTYSDSNNYIRNIKVNVAGASNLSEMTSIINNSITSCGFIVTNKADGDITFESDIDGHHIYNSAQNSNITTENLYHNRIINTASNSVSVDVSIIDTSTSVKNNINFLNGFSPRLKIELYVLDNEKLTRPEVLDLRAITKTAHESYI